MLEYFSDFIIEYITEVWAHPVIQLRIAVLLRVMWGSLHTSIWNCGNSRVILAIHDGDFV